MRYAAISGAPLGNGEHYVQNHGKDPASHGGNRLCEQVNYRKHEECQRDEAQAHRNLYAPDIEVQRYLELALARPRVTQDKDRQAVHREAPDHSKGIQVREKGDISTADN